MSAHSAGAYTETLLVMVNVMKGGVCRILIDIRTCRPLKSSLLCVTVHYTILRINHLFQNGRALLKCYIFIPPTTGNPDVEKSRSHAPVTTRTCPL